MDSEIPNVIYETPQKTGSKNAVFEPNFCSFLAPKPLHVIVLGLYKNKVIKIYPDTFRFSASLDASYADVIVYILFHYLKHHALCIPHEDLLLLLLIPFSFLLSKIACFHLPVRRENPAIEAGRII